LFFGVVCVSPGAIPGGAGFADSGSPDGGNTAGCDAFGAGVVRDGSALPSKMLPVTRLVDA
jgi:hypothetical protein